MTTPGYGTASLAIKVGYALATAVVVFVSMLVLTVLHPSLDPP